MEQRAVDTVEAHLAQSAPVGRAVNQAWDYCSGYQCDNLRSDSIAD
jgi:hypothetical protein